MKLNLTTFALLVCCISAESAVNLKTYCRINDERLDIGGYVGYRLDGCNNCFCSGPGFACTLMDCPWYQPLGCEIQGQHYNDYDIVPSDDCGQCRCRNGNLACGNCPA